METILNQITGGTEDQNASKSANLIPNKKDCMISYLVKYQIIQYENGKASKTIASKIPPAQRKFCEPRAIVARKKAFQYANEIYELSKIDGKLCDDKINAEYDTAFKLRKNYTGIKISVCFIVESNGKIKRQISGNHPYNANENFIKNMDEEYLLYLQFNYDMGDKAMILSINGKVNYMILNMSTTGVCDKLYHISKVKSIEIAEEKQICSNLKEPIILYPTDQLADNIALKRYQGECTYLLSEIAVHGIFSSIDIRNYNFCNYKEVWGYVLKQERISQLCVIKSEICNTADHKHYEDFKKKTENILLENQKDEVRNKIQDSLKYQRTSWLNLYMGIEKFIEQNSYVFRENEVILRKILNEEFEKWYYGLDPIDRKKFDVRKSTKRFDL